MQKFKVSNVHVTIRRETTINNHKSFKLQPVKLNK